MKKYNKIEFLNRLRLYFKQKWLMKKKDELNELISICDNDRRKILIYDLLQRFNYLDQGDLSIHLNNIADYIINKSCFEIDTTQLLSITNDDAADSGQKILDMIKIPLYKSGWRNPRTVNRFGRVVYHYEKGRKQIIIIDEFIGSGKTLRDRLNRLKTNITGDFEVRVCYIAGIESVIETLRKEGVEIYCSLPIKKGISEHFNGDALNEATEEMLILESKLSETISEKVLVNFSFGYGKAEALYTMEGCLGNTPNSVFPIFWWDKDNLNNHRNTLLTRVESGF
jgi:hypothetical protein